MNWLEALHMSLRIIVIILAACFLLVFVCPLLQSLWCLAFPHYDHEVAVLPFDVECRLPGADEGSLTLPKGLMMYAPCKHDFDRMSLEETSIYKVYVKLDAQTLKMLVKDSDKSKNDEFLKLKRTGTLELLGRKSQSSSSVTNGANYGSSD